MRADTLRTPHQRRHVFLAGTKGGEKKIPESLGLAPGVVFLLCIIFFQLLHFYDAAAVLDWVSPTTCGLG